MLRFLQIALVSWVVFAPASSPNPAVGSPFKERPPRAAPACASESVMEMEIARNPNYGRQISAMKANRKRYVDERGGRRTRDASNVRTINVVVHVLYRTEAENLSDAQIESQIRVLTEDFRMTNADATTRWPQAADTGYEFNLAQIKRVQTTRTSWSSGQDLNIKSTSGGGSDPVDITQNLNIWVCNLDQILGYAYLPPAPAGRDGVVVGHLYFGYGSAASGFDLGRTTTHEVGHWLGLEHIWGGGCSSDDGISDTPNAGGPNYGCGAATSCNTEDMTDNFMDYSDDRCMTIFTAGQGLAMDFVFSNSGPRSNFQFVDLTVPCSPTIVGCAACSADDATVCVSCSPGFTDDGQNGCFDCVASSGEVNCQSCSQNGECAECAEGFSLTGGACISCNIDNCAACSANDVCALCASGFGLEDDRCLRPTYCSSGATQTVDSIITRLEFAGTDYTGTGCSTYQDLTGSQTATVQPGQTYQLTIAHGDCDGGSAYNKQTAVFFDFNGDREFTTNERLFLSPSSSVETFTASITVPADAQAGEWILRAITNEDTGAPDACDSFSWGEVIDMRLVIDNPCLQASDCGVDGCTVYSCNSGQCSSAPFDCGTPATACSTVTCDASSGAPMCTEIDNCPANPNACFIDTCLANGSCQTNVPFNCGNDQCLDYTCADVSGTATCSSTPTVCNDNNDCTADTCNDGCVYTDITCPEDATNPDCYEYSCAPNGGCQQDLKSCDDTVGQVCGSLSLEVCNSCDSDNGGYCWFRGNAGQSCATVCSNNGLTYDDAATETAAGSINTCVAIANDAGLFGFSTRNRNRGNRGCYYDSGRNRLTSEVGSTSGASNNAAQRFCVCA